jgi:hypothetical protein
MERWTPELETKVRTGTDARKGSSCYFVPVSETMGLKLYATAQERDASYVAQSIVAEHGLAPDVGECVDLKGLQIPSGSAPNWWHPRYKEKTPLVMYGFLTEKVKTNPGYNPSAEIDLRDSLTAILDLPWNFCDLYGDNIGEKNGRPVCVDLDPRFCDLLSDADYEVIEPFYEYQYRMDAGL